MSAQHLAISILFALNLQGFAQGWHDAEPFAAWPATNHLRWMTNVGTYTNESNWQGTNGYGAWTNNYLLATNLWVGHTYLYGPGQYIDMIAPHYFRDLPYAGATSTNMRVQPKDVRAMDVDAALLERWLVSSPSATVSNYHAAIDKTSDSEPIGVNDWLYKSEAKNLWRSKQYVRLMLTNYYSGSGTTFSNWTESTLCVAAGYPTNFLTSSTNQMVWRNASGSWTPYANIMTSMWTIATASSNVVTNTTVDSWGAEVTLIGTNGQQFSRIITNSMIQAGSRAEDYGWAGVRACITNLHTTVITVAWTNGGITNAMDAFSDDADTNNWNGSFYTPPYAGSDAAAISNAQMAAIYAVTTGGTKSVTTRVPQEIAAWSIDSGYLGTHIFSARQSVYRHYLVASPPKTNIGYTAYFLAKVGTYANGEVQSVIDFATNSITATNGGWASFGTTGIVTGRALSSTTFPESFTTNGLTPASFIPWWWGGGQVIDEIMYAIINGWQVKDKKAFARWDFEYK